MADEPIQISVNFNGIVEAIGRGEGIADAANEDAYVASLIKAAHAVATKEFDVDLAATAGPANLSHVFEFGTNGITRGAPRFMDPTDAAARLYVHGIEGEGRVQSVFFAFRPAVQPNPAPSAKFYGVESEVIARLSNRKYIFRNKAAIVEYGETVYIKPKDKKVNFVPFYGKGSTNYAPATHIFRPGPPLREPMESNPGVDSGMKGTFTAFWESWWNGPGQRFMDGDANRRFNDDVKWILDHPVVGGELESVTRFNSRGRIYNRRRYYKDRMLLKAAERRKIDRR